MIAAEVLALVALLFGGAVAVKVIWSWLTVASHRDQERARRKDRMRDELILTLKSRDYRQLDDFIVVWADEVDTNTLKHIKAIRDGLFVDSNA